MNVVVRCTCTVESMSFIPFYAMHKEVSRHFQFGAHSTSFFSTRPLFNSKTALANIAGTQIVKEGVGVPIRPHFDRDTTPNFQRTTLTSETSQNTQKKYS